jgi:hypothetical protein
MRASSGVVTSGRSSVSVSGCKTCWVEDRGVFQNDMLFGSLPPGRMKVARSHGMTYVSSLHLVRHELVSPTAGCRTNLVL